MTMQDRRRQSNSGECPVCHGTGWEITLEILEGYREPLALAKRCSRCRGKRYINDQTGIPPEYCNADLSKYTAGIWARCPRSLMISWRTLTDGRNRAKVYIFGVRHREAARPFSPAAWQDL